MKKKNEVLKINIHLEQGECHEQFLFPLESCRNGNCRCNSCESHKLRGMDISINQTKLTLSMIPHKGMMLDENVISRCIDSLSN